MALDLFTIVGIVGTALMIAAIVATLKGWLTAEDWQSPLANLVGAILVLISLITAWLQSSKVFGPRSAFTD